MIVSEYNKVVTNNLKKMKSIGIKLALLVIGFVMITSCGKDYKSRKDILSENQNLLISLSQNTQELDEMMGMFNQIQEGFKRIKEAEGRVDMAAAENGSTMSRKERIEKDLEIISQAISESRAQIDKLQKQLLGSQTRSTQLQKAINTLQAELEEKSAQIDQLKSELESKDLHIAQLGERVESLNEDVSELQGKNQEQKVTIESQIESMNKGWFVYGTRRELKDQGILDRGEVLKTTDFNQKYFIEVDIRTEKNIPFHSKRVKVMTTHPLESYSLNDAEDGTKVLKIIDTAAFWSVSKYVVVLVR